MKKLSVVVLLVAVLLFGTDRATARDRFDTPSLRGRYTGHLAAGANFSDGTMTQRLDIQLLSALTFDGKASVTGGSIITVTVPAFPGQTQTPFTCPFDVTGTYQLGDDGLGSATLVLAVRPGQVCGDGGSGVTLQLSLVVGGHNRKRLDVTINSAIDSESQALPIVGAGMLEK